MDNREAGFANKQAFSIVLDPNVSEHSILGALIVPITPIYRKSSSLMPRPDTAPRLVT